MTTSIVKRATSRWEFIALIAGMMALNSLAIDVMLPALPALGADLGVADENEPQYVIAIYMLGFGLAQLVYGPLTDRFGRRPPLFVGFAIYVGAAFLSVFAPNFATLLALRFIQGLGAAAQRVVATSVVRDRFSGRDMAEVMSLAFMVFMALPVVAPGVGQLILIVGGWHDIFLFMAALAGAIGLWAWFRLPETLPEANRRPLTLRSIGEGFRLVVTNRVAFFYGLGSMLLFGGLFGYITSSQQIYVDIYALGPYFPIAFAVTAGVMMAANYTNARIVQRLGTRRISHGAVLLIILVSGTLAVWSAFGPVPLVAFFCLVTAIMALYGFAPNNINSLAMEPLGAVAGTASSVFGFMQTLGGAMIGTYTGQQFNGTVTPIALGYLLVGLLTLAGMLVAEKGKLFGVSERYRKPEAAPAR